MLSTRWQPRSMWTEVNRLQDEMDRLFNRFSGNQNRQFARDVFPAINVWEDDDNLYMEAELAGFELDELDLTVTRANELSVKGERKQPTIENGAWHRQERGYGSFARLVELPHRVAADKVSAEFRHGVLKVTLPKQEEAKPRRIEVKSS